MTCESLIGRNARSDWMEHTRHASAIKGDDARGESHLGSVNVQNSEGAHGGCSSPKQEDNRGGRRQQRQREPCY